MGQGYSYSSGSITYNPNRNSLFLVGHGWHNEVGEISIPPLVNTTNLNSLNRSAMVQALTDITGGNMSRILAGGGDYGDTVVMGGMLVHKNSLIGSVYGYYDAGSSARLSHFKSGLDISVRGDFAGMYQVGQLNPGFVSGYITHIPRDWQGHFGGTALAGNGGISIICRSSLGPAASVFNPDDLGVLNPVPATPVVGYTCANPTLGGYDPNGTAADPNGFNQTTTIRGIVFPEGSRSVLFFGRQQLGNTCYGYGTTDLSLVGTVDSLGVEYCYDPTSPYKGGHGYPFASWVWAYDANDLLEVKNGRKQMWEVFPYATWKLDLPFERDPGNGGIAGAAYDPLTQTIYLSRDCQDVDMGCGPVIHAFRVR
jgi:hypothetical protein